MKSLIPALTDRISLSCTVGNKFILEAGAGALGVLVALGALVVLGALVTLGVVVLVLCVVVLSSWHFPS